MWNATAMTVATATSTNWKIRIRMSMNQMVFSFSLSLPLLNRCFVQSCLFLAQKLTCFPLPLTNCFAIHVIFRANTCIKRTFHYTIYLYTYLFQAHSLVCERFSSIFFYCHSFSHCALLLCCCTVWCAHRRAGMEWSKNNNNHRHSHTATAKSIYFKPRGGKSFKSNFG